MEERMSEAFAGNEQLTVMGKQLQAGDLAGVISKGLAVFGIAACLAFVASKAARAPRPHARGTRRRA